MNDVFDEKAFALEEDKYAVVQLTQYGIKAQDESSELDTVHSGRKYLVRRYVFFVCKLSR